MITSRLIYSAFLPFTIWLIYGAPDLRLAGNLVMLLVVVAHLFTVIWVRIVFALFQGDVFTYGAVAAGFNISSFITTFVSGLITFWVYDGTITHVSMISPFAWGVVCLGFLVTIAIPVLSTRHIAPLPKAAERRAYESPASEDS